MGVCVVLIITYIVYFIQLWYLVLSKKAPGKLHLNPSKHSYINHLLLKTLFFLHILCWTMYLPVDKCHTFACSAARLNTDKSKKLLVTILIRIFVFFLLQDDSIQQQWLPSSRPRRRTQLRSLCPGRVWWCHHITDCNTSFGLSVIHHWHGVQPVPSTAQPLPGGYYDHHHRRDYCRVGAGFYYYLNDTVQSLQQPRGRPWKSSHCSNCGKTSEQRTRRRRTGPSPPSLCLKNAWQSWRPSDWAIQGHVA